VQLIAGLADGHPLDRDCLQGDLHLQFPAESQRFPYRKRMLILRANNYVELIVEKSGIG
jgi:hypothetical protein